MILCSFFEFRRYFGHFSCFGDILDIFKFWGSCAHFFSFRGILDILLVSWLFW